MTRTTKTSQSGFTLVELAIVMIIIGLLIGGVLKGQELIDNARITAVAKRVTPIETAMLAFRASYGTIPGDLRAATAVARMADCTGDCALGQGNGNGRLAQGPGTITGPYYYAQVSENQQFWAQLAAAGLFDGVDPRTTNGGTQSVAWGVTSPAAPIEGTGFEVAQWNAPAIAAPPYTSMRGIHLIMRLAISTNNDWNNPYEGPDASALNNRGMHMLDTKLDDGVPGTGRVRSIQAVGGATYGCGTSPYGATVAGYADTWAGGEENNCMPLIKIGG